MHVDVVIKQDSFELVHGSLFVHGMKREHVSCERPCMLKRARRVGKACEMNHTINVKPPLLVPIYGVSSPPGSSRHALPLHGLAYSCHVDSLC